jgi:mycofactocin system glycosyltransferase
MGRLGATRTKQPVVSASLRAGSGPADRSVPVDHRLVLDSDTRVSGSGTVLIGGSPLRVLRLTAEGAALVGRWTGGEPVGTSPAAQQLARRLMEAGLAHARPGPSLLRPGDVTLVVPVHDGAHSLARVLESVGDMATNAIVVDDGSIESTPVALVAQRYGARLARLDRNLGPAGARNHGWRMADTAVVAFLDADCRARPHWADPLVAHLNDPAVALVAPRVVAGPSGAPRWLSDYERQRSPLDLGPSPSPIRPRSRVPYVPAAALVVRRDALEDVGGFDETLRVGEDVDLVWRMAEAGWSLVYQPLVEVVHASRARLGEWARQRYQYGTSAAALDLRHPRAAAPVAMSGWSALAWFLAAAGAPVSAGAVVAGTTAALVPRLRKVPNPVGEAVRLAGHGHLAAGRMLAESIRRTWTPAAVGLALVSRRSRLALAAATLAPVSEWIRGDRSVRLPTWLALRLADDLAYAAGVWAGSVSAHHWGALVPDLSGWPGRSQD